MWLVTDSDLLEGWMSWRISDMDWPGIGEPIVVPGGVLSEVLHRGLHTTSLSARLVVHVVALYRPGCVEFVMKQDFSEVAASISAHKNSCPMFRANTS